VSQKWAANSAISAVLVRGSIGDYPQVGWDPSLVQTSVPDVNWQTLMPANNIVGREWLQNQLSIAQHLLTSDQINQVMAGFQMPSLLAAKAAEASGLPLGPLQLDPNVADTCKNGTWSNCGVAIKQQLDRNPANPIDVAELAALWGAAFDAQYDVLRKQGYLEKSVPEDERIEEILNDHLNPLEVAKDHAEDVILDR
jgi:hypothetical protein